MVLLLSLDATTPIYNIQQGKLPELISFRLNPGLGRTDSETKSNVLGGPDAKVPCVGEGEGWRVKGEG